MTNFTKQKTRTGGRIEKLVVFAATAALWSGCNDDSANNSSVREPIAVTESGIEIVEVTRRMEERTVEAVIVIGGEERQVTMKPILDGPLPSGFTAQLDGGDHVAYGWSEHSGAIWFQQQSGENHFEMMRAVANGRVAEDYIFNDRSLHLEYVDLPASITDKALNKYAAGESLESASPEVVELADAFSSFESFVADLPAGMTSGDNDVLASLLSDPNFAVAITGEEPDPNRPDGLCKFFNVCAAISCKFLNNIQVCTICAAGSLACLFMDWFCYMWCHAGG